MTGIHQEKDLLICCFETKNKEVSTLVVLERLRAEMTRKTSSPILTKSSKKTKVKKAYRVYDR